MFAPSAIGRYVISPTNTRLAAQAVKSRFTKSANTRSGLDPALLLKSEQVLGPHQTSHSLAIDALSRRCSAVVALAVVEFSSDATSAPDAVFSVENCLDLRGHHSVIYKARTAPWSRVLPLVIRRPI